MSFTSSLTCESDTTLSDLPPTPGLDLIVWESAAKQILRDYDNQDIRLLYRFFPFDDLGVLDALLRDRWMPFFNALLIYIGEDEYGREFVDALSVDQTINKISKWLQLPFSTQESRCEWAWIWTQQGALNKTASTIAYNIDKDSCSQFAKIPFQDLIFSPFATYKCLTNCTTSLYHQQLGVSMTPILARYVPTAPCPTFSW